MTDTTQPHPEPQEASSLPPYIYGRETGPNEKVWTQAAATALRAERDAARADAQELRAIASSRGGEIMALKAAPVVDADRIMELADEMVRAKTTAEHANQYGSLSKWKLWTEAYEAARSALRSAIEGRKL